MISVIIPCYNCSQTIEKCVNSFLNQTYQDFELLLLDDGSTDKTLAVLESIKHHNCHINIRVFHHNNIGVSETRNQGIKEAVGDYIAFTDSDDYVYPTYLETLLAGFNESVDLSVIGFCKSSEKPSQEIKERKLISKKEFFQELFRNKLVQGFLWNKLYLSSIIKGKNIFFKSHLKMMEDLEFNLRYWQYVRQVSLSSEQLYYYVIHSGSTMNSDWNDNKLAVIHSFNEMLAQPSLSDTQREILELDFIRVMIWLSIQFYRTSNATEVRKNEQLIFEQLRQKRSLFLKKGHEVGMRYYMSYLFFTICPNSLNWIAKLSQNVRNFRYTC